MGSFVLSSDSCCDIPKSSLDARKISMVPLTFITEKDGKLEERKDDFLENEAEVVKFYYDVSNGMTAKTSQLTVHDHLEYFRGLLQSDQKDVLHITLSSGLSGTYDQAVIASKMLREEFPNRAVHVVDSLAATVAQRLLVDEAEKLRDANVPAGEAAESLRKVAANIQAHIMVDDLNHLKRGGRISGAVAVIGTILNIKPYIVINHEGRLVVLEKNKGVKRSIERIVRAVEKFGVDEMEGAKIYVVHTNALDTAKQLKAAILEKFPKADAELALMGPVIGAHVGPGTIAAAFVGKPRSRETKGKVN